MSSTFFKTIGIRLWTSALVLVGVSILIFCIARVIPGDPARIALGPNATQEQVELLRDRLHLNEPLPAQYFEFVRELFQGNLGVSLYTNRPVTTDIADTLPATLELVVFAGILMVAIGIPLGVLAARYRDKLTDNVVRLLSLLGVVTPTFVWAVFLMLVFAFYLEILPVAGRLSQGVDPPPDLTGFYTIDALLAGQWSTFWDALAHIILPATALAMTAIGQTARMTRANVAESYDTPYVEMAQAYGFSERRIASKYALRPAMIPSLTIMGLDFAAMLGGAFLVEAVFAWPGLARYGVETILHKDLNGIVGTVLVISAFFLIVNMLVDVAVAWLNPRIRLQKRWAG
ncbi:MAG: ABC transporter permease [Pseudomonadota bacterium]